MMDPLEVKSVTERKYWQLCQPVVRSESLELFDLEFNPRSSLLRLYIYNPATKTAIIEECARVDQALTPVFESEENSWIPESLILEVSSPGLTRKLKWPYQYNFAIGERVSLQYIPEGENSKIKKITANLNEIRANSGSNYEVVLSTKENSTPVIIPMGNIKKGQLDPLF